MYLRKCIHNCILKRFLGEGEASVTDDYGQLAYGRFPRYMPYYGSRSGFSVREVSFVSRKLRVRWGILNPW
jgi:hypothetical protein